MDVSRQSGPAAPLLGLLSLLVAAPLLHAAAPAPAESAARVDAAFRRALPAGAPLPARADDATFLRRICLDLTGKMPDPDELRRWTADTTPDKRARLIDRLLHGEAYAVNWARYWRDVVTYHTPASANYLRWELFDRWWVEQLRRNRPWDQIVTALVTSSGINDEIAPVNYLTALYGNPVEIAATTSRVFLGVQIQCAQCHDAKTEPWKREQFHQFAAFFGRARLIQHKDVTGRGTPYAIESRSDGQYRMTDKKAPDRLLAMQPRFLTGESVNLDASDEERRQALARFLTGAKNPWFARCYVNRMWTALLGWGFYSTVNDVGGAEKPRYAEVLQILERDWIASGRDVRWLFQVIARTQAYQGRLQAQSRAAGAPAACPVRLRPEQVFEALQQALGFDEKNKTIPAPAPSSAPAVQRHQGLRNMVYQMFKTDPSLPQAQMQGTIPQALLMMNSALVQVATSAKGKTVLADLLAKGKSDDEILIALYERVLSRKPTAQEKTICLRYIRKIGQRPEALEDVLWGLVNSTEFLLKKQDAMLPVQSCVDVRVNGRGVVSRRAFLRGVAGGAAAAGLRWSDRLSAHADELRKQGKACILLWMAGGPSQFETFDPKPGADTQGPTKAIATSVPGLRIAEHWTRLAPQMKDVALLRSLTSTEGNHGRATYLLHTSYAPSGGIVHPGFGSTVARELGPDDSDLPHFVSISGASIGPSYLGVRYAPFVVTDPNQPPDNLLAPVPGERLGRRLDLLAELEAQQARGAAGSLVRDHQTLYKQTAQMVLSPRTQAFRLDLEPDRMRDFYGRSAFGQGCLMARRLVEAGVAFIEVQSSGWDTHGNELTALKKLIPPVDQGTAALLADLRTRGLLDRTLVVWMGEFGRMPHINLTAGRDHYPHVFDAVLAGCGIQGGRVVGATDARGAEIVERPIGVPDLFCTFCRALGLDPRSETQSNVGRPIKIVEHGSAVREVF